VIAGPIVAPTQMATAGKDKERLTHYKRYIFIHSHPHIYLRRKLRLKNK